MVAYFGLYYPFIHFRDEAWLKLAALYWDGMSRIVPMGARLHDSDEVKRLADAQFILNEPPFGAFDVAQLFRDLIASHGDALQTRFGIAHRDTWPDDRHTRLYAPAAMPSSPTSSTRRWIGDFSAISSSTDSWTLGATIRGGLECIRNWSAST